MNNLDRKALARLVLGRFKDALERGCSEDEAVAEATNIPGGPPLGNFAIHMRNGLVRGLRRRAAITEAMEGAFGPDQSAMPTEREQMTARLAARFESEMAAHGDPTRAATAAAAILPGSQYGIAHHMAAAAESGLDPLGATRQAVADYFGGGAKPFGHQLAERADLRQPLRERPATRRRWDDLKPPERSIVANYLVRDGRPGEEPTSADIDAAFETLTRS